MLLVIKQQILPLIPITLALIVLQLKIQQVVIRLLLIIQVTLNLTQQQHKIKLPLIIHFHLIKHNLTHLVLMKPKQEIKAIIAT